MKPLETISLRDVLQTLRRGSGCALENSSGICVFVDLQGNKRFVFDDESGEAVPYQRVAFIQQWTRGSRVMPIFIS